MNSDIDQHKINFQRIIAIELPKSIALLEQLISARNLQIGKLDDAREEDLSKEAVAISTGCLVSIQDIFTALRKQLHKHDENNYSIHTFPRSTNALVRLALENLALFQWIDTEDQLRSTHSKTFAFLIYNTEEGEKYYRSLGDSINSIRLKEQLDFYVSMGLKYGYLTRDPEGKKAYLKSAFAKIPNITELCTSVKTLDGFPEDQRSEILRNYPGMGNAAFLYRFFSGHVHGLQWVTKFESNEGLPTKQEIIYWLPNMALGTVIAYLRAL